MPNVSGPIVALAVLAIGAIVVGVYFALERRHAHGGRAVRAAERLPLFGTDQLAIRHLDGTTSEPDEAREPVVHASPVSSRPAVTPSAPQPVASTARNGHRPPRPAPAAPPVAASAGARSPYAPPVGGDAFDAPRPRPEPRAEPRAEPRPEPRPEPRSEPRSEPWITRPTPAPTQRSRTVEHAVPGARTSSAATGALVVGEPSAIDAALMEGETLRFTVPTDGTVEFLPGRLEVVAGPDAGREIRFVRAPDNGPVEVSFGRSDGPAHRHVQILARTVSRRHAVMSLIDEHWQLTNVSSTNPLVLNGRALVTNEVAPLLIEGDRIEMGEVVFVYHDG